MSKSTLTWFEAAAVALICFGLFVMWSLEAVLSGFPPATFTDAGNWWMVGVELILAAAALLYLRARRFDIALLYPQPTLAGTGVGLLLFVACSVAGALSTAVLGVSGQDEVIAFSFEQTTLVSRIGLALVNGSFEEVFLLGVLVRGLRGHGLSMALGVPLLVRVLYHLYQGPLGVVWVASFGVVLSLAYVRRQDLWPPVLAHILWDIVPTL